MKNPAPHERVYVRDAKTGDRGYFVSGENGEVMVQLDRPSQVILKAYNENEWVRDKVDSPLTRMQVAHVAFLADCGLCAAVGLHKESRRVWAEMKVDDRISWSKRGPVGKEHLALRRKVFDLLMGALHGDSK